MRQHFVYVGKPRPRVEERRKQLTWAEAERVRRWKRPDILSESL